MGGDSHGNNDDAQFYSDLLRAYLDSASDAIFVLCDEMKFLACNNEMQDWLGLPESTLIKHNKRIPVTELLGSLSSSTLFTSFFETALAGTPVRFETMIFPLTGEARWVEFSLKKVEVDTGDMVISIARDISEKKKHMEELEFHASHDVLTGLLNREKLLAEITTLGQKKYPFSVIHIDIDRFKEINDALGHRLGDYILIEFSKRLNNLASEFKDTIVARLSGDEFAIVINSSNLADALTMASCMKHAVSTAYEVETLRMVIGVSIGIAAYPEHGNDASTTLRKAEVAMHSAKQQSKSTVIYDANIESTNIESLSLIADLKDAVTDAEITAAYQPIVDMRNPAAAQLEILARWHHPTKGDIPPDIFIPLAERSGQIKALSLLIARTAFIECAGFVKAGLVSSLSLNISPVLFSDVEIFDQLDELKSKHGLTRDQLILEVTESAMMSELTYSQDNIKKLDNMGVIVAIDDFGTGHSSLQKLKQLPVDSLKIDKSFIIEMAKDANDLAIVEATINMAHTLNMNVVAEGIENKKTWNLLKKLGCDYGQGFWIARPMPFSNVQDWIDNFKL